MPEPNEAGAARTELVVLVGLQASGKSTFYARTFAGTHALVSKDLFRGARHRQRRQMRLVDEALAQGVPVVVDNTNPSPAEWDPLVAAARSHGVPVVAYWFPPDLIGSLLRNAVREGPAKVPEAGLYATLKRLRRPRTADGFDAVHEVRLDGHGGFLVRPAAEPSPGVTGARPRTVVVFDLDGTLADVRHRLHLVRARPRDWDAFFAAAPADPPLADGVRLALACARQCGLAYVTGRPESCRRATEEWLARQGLPAGPLLMRRDGDRRPARTVKPELLRSLAQEQCVTAVVDDDEQVCAAYEAAGFRVLHAPWMEPQPLLEYVQEREGRT